MTYEHILPFLGSITPTLANGITLTTGKDQQHANVTYLTLEAKADFCFTAAGYDNPSVYLTFTPADSPRAAHLHFLGFQTCEFAMPIYATDTTLSFRFFSRAGFVRPHSALPLFVFDREAGSDTILLAPVDAFHEQVMAIRDGRLCWGWSGDLENIGRNFRTTLAVVKHQSPRAALYHWGELVRTKARRNPTGRYDSQLLSHISYWTDNGAAYWYRREPGASLPDGITAAVNHIEKTARIAIGTVELDSWFYPHAVTREVRDVGYLHVVPPTGLSRWEPRFDVLGGAGITGLRARLNGRPLALHVRHIASASPYVTDDVLGPWWIDNDRAHPQSPVLWGLWMQQAASWGATVVEHDWLVEVWQGVRALRAVPGRIYSWQSAFDSAARHEGLSLVWCMATPPDMTTAASLPGVLVARSCDDYRYADDPSTLWRWHLIVSTLLHALGLLPFKDVFMSHHNSTGVPDVDGDPHALLEACLATLSAGPVGLGDRAGRTDPSVIAACARADGVIVKPDAPLRAMDRSFRDPSALLWADTKCGVWRYIVVMRTGVKSRSDSMHLHPVRETLPLDENSGSELFIVYDWRRQHATVTSVVEATLCIHEWRLWIACPLLSQHGRQGTFTLIGDATRFATMGDRRVRLHTDISQRTIGNDGLLFDILGHPGEEVDILFWSDGGDLDSKRVSIPARAWIRARLTLDENSSCAHLQLDHNE